MKSFPLIVRGIWSFLYSGKVSDWNLIRANQNYTEPFKNLFPNHSKLICKTFWISFDANRLSWSLGMNPRIELIYFQQLYITWDSKRFTNWYFKHGNYCCNDVFGTPTNFWPRSECLKLLYHFNQYFTLLKNFIYLS